MTEEPTDHTSEGPEAEGPVEAVEVRRNLVLAVAIGGLATLLAAAFAARAFRGGELVDWVGLTVLGVIALVHLATVLDSRAPLLVADDHGVRFRDGSRWQGIAWPEIECLEHLPRRGLLKDGHLLVVGYDDRQLIVPLTLATKVTGADLPGLSDRLADLADGRADVVEVVPGLDDAPETDAPDDAAAADDTAGTDHGADLHGDDRRDDAPTDPTPTAERPAVPLDPDHRDDRGPHGPGGSTGALGAERPGAGDDPEDDRDRRDRGVPGTDDIATGEMEAVPPVRRRPTVLPARVDVHRNPVRGALESITTIGANALRRDSLTSRASVALPEEELLRRTAEDASVEPGATVAGEEATVVLADLSVKPATEPVVGPQLAAARERLRLTVDQVAERTRVRPHVIEAIEVDDFTPCGGDFYARGHLRTLGRVLGVDSGPLVATYDERYADAPVDPRRVFQSELATGVGGSIRGTRGGRNWSVLVAAVMAAVLVWSIAQLVMDGPVELDETPVLNQSGGLPKAGAGKADPIGVTLTAVGGGADVVVRDAAGDIVFDGSLAFGQEAELDVVPPVRVWTSDGSVTASVEGEDAEPLGETGSEVNKTLVP